MDCISCVVTAAPNGLKWDGERPRTETQEKRVWYVNDQPFAFSQCRIVYAYVLKHKTSPKYCNEAESKTMIKSLASINFPFASIVHFSQCGIEYAHILKNTTTLQRKRESLNDQVININFTSPYIFYYPCELTLI